MALVGRVFSNRYEIEREIAQGGMAEVYLARDQLLDRPVALKALSPSSPASRRSSSGSGARRRPPPTSTTRTSSRSTTGARSGHVLHRHGVRRGPLAPRPDPQRRARSTPARPPTSPPRSRRRSRSRTATGRAPRREARQRADHARGHGEGHRLRHRARRRQRRPHADRLGDGHRHLLLARAGAGPRRSTAAPTSTRSASCSTRW